jgi:hypothetical protein
VELAVALLDLLGVAGLAGQFLDRFELLVDGGLEVGLLGGLWASTVSVPGRQGGSRVARALLLTVSDGFARMQCDGVILCITQLYR